MASSYGPGGADIFIIEGDIQSAQKIEQVWGDVGLQEELKDEVLRIGVLGQAAAKSMVPVRKRELQNDLALIGTPLDMHVTILPSHRTTSNTHDQLFNPVLAEILNEGLQRKSPKNSISVKRINRSGRRRRRRSTQAPLTRSRTGQSYLGFDVGQKGQSTADWVGQAQKNLTQRLDNGG